MQAGACSSLVPLITSDIRTEQISQHSPGQLAQEKHCFSVVILCSTGTAHLKPAMHLARLLSTVVEGLSRRHLLESCVQVYLLVLLSLPHLM